MDTTLRLERTNRRWPAGPPKDPKRPAGPRFAALVPKDGAPRATSFAWIAAIPQPMHSEPRGAFGAPAVPRFLPPGAHQTRPPRRGAPAMRRRPRAGRAAGRSLTSIAAPARELRVVLARLDDDRELTALKIVLLGLLVLAAAALERLWT